MHVPTPKERIESVLRHADPTYDPQKAHEYYLRTRQLVGRQPGAAVVPTTKTSGSNTVAASPKKAPVAKKPTQTKQQQVEAQLQALQARFDKLKAILADLVAAAKARSGVDDPKSSAKTPSKETAAEKQKRSDAAKKYYEQHKDDKPQTPSQQLKALQQKIADIQAKIKKLKDEAALAAKKKQTSVQKSKPKPGPVGKTTKK